MALGRLVRWEGDIIMIKLFWPDQSCFPEIIDLAIEAPRRFRPSQWLLWNATTQKAIPKVMKSIQLTDSRLTSPSLPRVALEKKLPGTDSWTRGTKQNYQGMFEQWCSFCNERGLPVLKVW